MVRPHQGPELQRVLDDAAVGGLAAGVQRPAVLVPRHAGQRRAWKIFEMRLKNICNNASKKLVAEGCRGCTYSKLSLSPVLLFDLRGSFLLCVDVALQL